jgi:hypothetical protein
LPSDNRHLPFVQQPLPPGVCGIGPLNFKRHQVEMHSSADTRMAISACFVVGVIVGCSGRPARIEVVDIDSQDAGASAVQEYDKDGDGALSKPELKACPALLSAFGAYDTNKDDKIDAGELAARFDAWRASKIGITTATFYLKRGGRPLVGAKVTLEPEAFFKGAVKQATAETNSSGLAGPTLAPEDLPDGVRFGMHTGLYKIKVSHPSLKSQKYGDQSELGIEVPPSFDLYNPPVFVLTDK